MNELQDPDKPAGADVEFLSDGSYRKKNGQKIERGERNPWYVLMTIYGEQTGPDFDPILHEKNRRAWNAWACQETHRDKIIRLAEETGVSQFELEGWSEIRATVQTALISRIGSKEMIPDATRPADLSLSDFVNPIYLDKFICIQSLSFSNSRLGEGLSCEGANFQEHVSFEGADVQTGLGNFRSTVFNKQVTFEGVDLDNGATFESAEFKENASFKEATIGGKSDFTSATFHGHADFAGSTTVEDAVFGSVTFVLGADFTGSRFCGRTDFSDGAFKSTTQFENARFETEMPKFFQRQMHQDTTFTTDPANWPRVTAENAEAGKRAYTRLRQVMSDLHKPDDEHFFYRQEMRCKAASASKLLERLGFWLYRTLSDFGWSFERPAIALFCLWALGVAAFGGCFLTPAGTGLSADVLDSPIRTAMGLSLSNILSFMGINRLYFQDLLQGLPDVLQFIAGLQTILGFLLLFLLGLGLRTRFRLR